MSKTRDEPTISKLAEPGSFASAKTDVFSVDKDELVLTARDRFLSTYGLDTAGYTDPAFPVPIGPFVLKTRNPGLLPYHDLHHVATGFPSGVVGEAEISAFELRVGFGSPLVLMLCLGATAFGTVLKPRRILAAWRRSRGASGLYHTNVPYKDLLSMTVAELRSLMNIPIEGLSTTNKEDL